MNPRVVRPILIILELVVGVCAIAGGIALTVDPSGTLLGFQVTALHGVFADYRLPGLLLVPMGLFQLAAALANERKHLWDVWISAAAGGVLILWIAVEVVIIGPTRWTQAVFALVGFTLLYLGTELWREGLGPHLGLVEGFEKLGPTTDTGARRE